MSKRVIYKCQECGAIHSTLFGKCPQCGTWGTVIEVASDSTPVENAPTKKLTPPTLLSKVVAAENERIPTGLKDFDCVLGGGATLSSAILLGGEPGVGKSTLLIQTAALINKKVLYVTGEESASQVKSRADRLKLSVDKITILCTNSLDSVLLAVNSEHPTLLIVDSIQTIFCAEAGNIPGTVSQLKFCAAALIDWVKIHKSVLIMVAHATKEGAIAGPNTLMHMVDTVLSFEKNVSDTRFLHVQKNRFGPVDVLGIFSMGSGGLAPVTNVESLFLGERKANQPSGVCVGCVVDANRAFLVELQALVTESKAAVSRVYSEKIDSNRVSRVAAILEVRIGLKFQPFDIYANVAGGVKLTESGIDCALALALYSARVNIALPGDIVVIGELTLSGEVRLVPKIEQRVKTARAMGFKKILCAAKLKDVIFVDNIKDLIKAAFL